VGRGFGKSTKEKNSEGSRPIKGKIRRPTGGLRYGVEYVRLIKEVAAREEDGGMAEKRGYAVRNH